MKTSVDYHQSWTLHIERDDTDKWPDSQAIPRGSRTMRPQTIVAEVTSLGRTRIVIAGRRVLKDGALGQRITIHPYDCPEWARELVQAKIAEYQIGANEPA